MPLHIYKGCTSSILKGRVPKLASLGSHSIPRKVTTKHSGIGCSICETYTGEVGRPIIQQNSSKALISDHPSDCKCEPITTIGVVTHPVTRQ